jgi:hypothetical protein
MCANRFYEHIEDQKAAISIWISDLEDGDLFNDTYYKATNRTVFYGS